MLVKGKPSYYSCSNKYVQLTTQKGIRLNCVDHYQASLTPFDPPLFGSHDSTQQRNAPLLPVIRVFGATETGQKVCAHIHGALPYLFIEHHGSVEKHKGLVLNLYRVCFVRIFADLEKPVDSYIHQLRVSIDHALAISYRRNPYDGKAVFVAHITLVKGVPFFGYHVGFRYFLKIYLLNPLNMTRFADLLHQGAIMRQVFQPFEAHLQYILQWMCDFNLYGCAYIDCHKLKFRSPVPRFSALNDTDHKWHEGSIGSEWISDPSSFPRQSHCSIEVDICVQDILNRKQVQERNIHADFIERLRPLNVEEKLVHSLAGLWKDETRRRKKRMGMKEDDSSSPFPPEVLVSMSAGSRHPSYNGWIHETQYRRRVEMLATEEKDSHTGSQPSFDNFVKPTRREREIQNVLGSVEDLFPQNLQHTTFSSNAEHFSLRGNNTAPNGALVDEGMISLSNGNEVNYESDEDTAREIAMTQKHQSKMSQSHQFSNTYDDQPIAEKATKEIEHVATNVPDEGADEQITFDERRMTDEVREPRTIERTSEHDGIDHSASERSAKRRKISPTKESSEALPTILNDHGRQAHHSIGEDVNALKPEPPSLPNIRGQPKTSEKNAYKMSSQMSQSSIKANTAENFPGAFTVSKNLEGSQDRKKVEGESSLPRKNPIAPVILSHKNDPVTPRSKSLPSMATSPFTPGSEISVTIRKPADQIRQSLPAPRRSQTYVFGQPSPTSKSLRASFFASGYADVMYTDAFYSSEQDVPENARDYAGREFKLESNTVPYLPLFDPIATSPASRGEKLPIVIDTGKQDLYYEHRSLSCRLLHWEFYPPPPSSSEVGTWLRKDAHDHQIQQNERRGPGSQIRHQSQIEGTTQKNRYGAKFSQKKKSTSVRHETQYMSIMSLEVHVNTREDFVPNPEQDEIQSIFWCIKLDDHDATVEDSLRGLRTGILALSEKESVRRNLKGEAGIEVEIEGNELDLINRVIDIVRELDPDILTGYEVHNGSWGYLIERARINFEFDLCDEFSRTITQSHGRFGKNADRWGFNTTSTIRITGRHMINIWRAMRSELNLLQYTLENVAFHLLRRRVPHYHFRDLTKWFTGGNPRDLARCVQYFVTRVRLNLEILEANELVPRTSEQARLIGVDFFSVFSRGSQFKVESFMFRIAKLENFLLVSPSRKQVGHQNALECLPLVMEPQSNFYPSPLLVLDFQSLYPSIMIAYNYCYSTCLGRTVSWRGQNKLGFADFKRQPRLLELVKDSINIAPNGIMYVKQSMRQSLLAKMLSEILETRFMVKSGMKVDKQDKTLQQLLNNRQLALKLLANVTYGYTSASFSGRMPCSEIADSIVQTGRETLEKAIALIHSVTRWGAEVVYGDTDSLFVYLKGRTRGQAFDIGSEIAKAVTDMNPRPIRLKFEKVYHPSVLLAKKRYVGFKYESKEQKEPDFDAKGIETVRRDGTPAEQKIEEKALKILFRTADLSQVKGYFQRQCMKILQGRVSIQDFCFAREVKLGTYAEHGKAPPPPGALISTRRMLEDPRTEPQYGERVPYVVISKTSNSRLVDRCVAPKQLLKDDAAELDAEYYITKNLIPPLERIFNLVGANVRAWYDDMPKVQRVRDIPAPDPGVEGVVAETSKFPSGGTFMTTIGKKTLESYLKSSHCIACRTKLPPLLNVDGSFEPDLPALPLCVDCLEDPSTSMFSLLRRKQDTQQRLVDLEAVCRNCAGIAWGDKVKCDSQDCPVFYSRVRTRTDVKRIESIVDGISGEVEEGLQRETES